MEISLEILCAVFDVRLVVCAVVDVDRLLLFVVWLIYTRRTVHARHFPTTTITAYQILHLII